jgi:quinol monooxygenase YgiN
MLTITAIIRVRKGEEAVMRQALLDVAGHVRANEPATIGYHISQDVSDPCVFTTY